MVKKIRHKTLRIIDANLNRLKEGLRVCEDISRFILDDKSLTNGYKKIRHQVFQILDRSFVGLKEIIRARDIIGDVGKKSVKTELRRKDYSDIFFANIQRVKESVRVIEEFNKILNKDLSRSFKTIRYRIYELEKKTLKKFEALHCAR